MDKDKKIKLLEKRVEELEEELSLSKKSNNEDHALRAMVDSMPISCVVYEEGNIVYANPRFFETRNIDSKDIDYINNLRDSDILRFVHPEDHKVFLENMSNVFKILEDGEIFNAVRRIRGLHKRNYRYFSTYFIRSERNNKKMIIELDEDITERIKEEKNKIEEEKKNSIAAMGVTANHELNQPITVIKGYLEMLTDRLQKADGFVIEKDFIEKIDKALNQMTSILEKFKKSTSFNIGKYFKTDMIIFNEIKRKKSNKKDE